jgi:hypothetical protein
MHCTTHRLPALLVVIVIGFSLCGRDAVSIAVAQTAGPALSLTVGSAERVPPPAASGARWTSSDADIVTVYGDSFVVALKPGRATIRAGSAERDVVVTLAEEQVGDPASLKQFADDRAFTTADGRKCVGTELNGQLIGNVQEPRIDRNRVQNPYPLRDDEPMLWGVREGATLYDGAGTPVGTIAPSLTVGDQKVPATRINYGMTKVIGGRLHVYAFATRVRPAGAVRPLLDPADFKDGTVGSSAWLPLDDVVKKETLLERVGVGKGKLPRLPLEDRRYVVTGGDPKMYLTDAGGPELQINYYEKGVGAVPSHYLRRPNGTVNIIYNVPGFKLGGQSLDSLLINGGVAFRRAKGVRPITRPLYYPPGQPSAGEISPGKTITFVYGAVEAPGTETIFGWVAREALSEAR